MQITQALSILLSVGAVLALPHPDGSSQSGALQARDDGLSARHEIAGAGNDIQGRSAGDQHHAIEARYTKAIARSMLAVFWLQTEKKSYFSEWTEWTKKRNAMLIAARRLGALNDDDIEAYCGMFRREPTNDELDHAENDISQPEYDSMQRKLGSSNSMLQNINPSDLWNPDA